MSPQTFGKYVVVKSLGRGGMAQVYLARDALLERHVAIKVIHPHLASEPDFGERFRREAKLVASLRHAHIVQLHDFDVVDNQPFMVMEYLDGGTLKDRLAALRQQNPLEPMPLAEVARLLAPLASALDYAHAQGAVHRDIKPANILFTAQGEPVLSDFGLAKILADSVQISASGNTVGTPAYMSPEQATSEPVDARSDLYSLGVMLYEMVAGCVPFQGDSPTVVMLQHIGTPPPKPRQFNPNLPLSVQRVILQALAKDPAKRFANGQQMVSALLASMPGARMQPATPRATVAVPAWGDFQVPPPKEIATNTLDSARKVGDRTLHGVGRFLLVFLQRPIEAVRGGFAQVPPPKEIVTNTLDSAREVGDRTLRGVGRFLLVFLQRSIEALLAATVLIVLLTTLLAIVFSFVIARYAQSTLSNYAWYFQDLGPTKPYILNSSFFRQYATPYATNSTFGTISDADLSFVAPDQVRLSAKILGNPVTLDGVVFAVNGVPQLQLQHLNSMPLPFVDSIISNGINQGMQDGWSQSPVRVVRFIVTDTSLTMETANK